MKTLLISLLLIVSTPKVNQNNKIVKITSECDYQMTLTDSRGNLLIKTQENNGDVTIDLILSPKRTYKLLITTENGEKIKKEILIN